MSRMTAILRGLINRTETGKMKWRNTINDDAFASAVDTTGVVIRQISAGSGFTPEQHRLEILNDDGLTAAVLETNDEIGLVPPENLATLEQAQELRRLFVLARHSALDVDSTLEKLVHDLESFR